MTRPLDEILARTRKEIVRRRRRASGGSGRHPSLLNPREVVEALRREPGQGLHVIAEIKFRSPSAGQIRSRRVGEVQRLARSLEEHGASAISILADGPAFGGGVLDVRRGAQTVGVPVLFKGFVLDEVQLDLAREVGASLVLLLVRCLSKADLVRLVRAATERGLVPLVEAMNEAELIRALDTGADVVGVNARDLGTFKVDLARAERALRDVPAGRVAIQMSGIRDLDTFRRAAAGRADAVLVGEGLMRAADPGRRLQQFLQGVPEAAD